MTVSEGKTRLVDAVNFSETQSLCPECLARIPAVRFPDGENLYVRKTCPVHGQFESVLWRGTPSYEGWQRPKVPWHPPRPRIPVDRGCPFDCGLCPEHRQQTCTALLEVTQRCNLSCAFCFARSGEHTDPDPDMRVIRGWYEAILANGIRCNVQLSGGEPSVRDDLPEIVALGRSLGFEFIQLNTNGLRLAADPRYVERLKAAGLASVFLQFDGTTEDCHTKLRGRPLFESKLRAIRHCADHGIGVVLVPTVVPGVNDLELGSIVRFARDQLPTVRGVHFQPVSYFGRYPTQPSDADRITIPEIIRNLEVQTRGMVKAHDFAPPGCEKRTLLVPRDLCAHAGWRAEIVLATPSRAVLLWHDPSSGRCGKGSQICVKAVGATDRNVLRNQHGFTRVLGRHSGTRAGTHTLSISGMAFQDAWNIDLERVKDCCIHVVARDGRLVPFCAYNLTSSSGHALYTRGGRS